MNIVLPGTEEWDAEQAHWAGLFQAQVDAAELIKDMLDLDPPTKELFITEVEKSGLPPEELGPVLHIPTEALEELEEVPPVPFMGNEHVGTRASWHGLWEASHQNLSSLLMVLLELVLPETMPHLEPGTPLSEVRDTLKAERTG